MPKTHSYGASYPSGSVIAHDGEVVKGPDEGNEAPRIEDDSRPGGAENAAPIDQEPAQDGKPDETQDDRAKNEDDSGEVENGQVTPIKAAKRATRAQR